MATFTVKYRTRVKKHDEGLGQPQYQLVLPVEPCCEQMTRYLQVAAVSFGDEPMPVNSYTGNSAPDGRLEKQLSIFTAEEGYDGCGSIDHEAHAINFCPGCGAKIELVEVERIELTPRKVQKVQDQVIWEEARRSAGAPPEKTTNP